MKGGDVTDLPLHVRVAEALGWTEPVHIPIEELKEHDHWTGKPPESWPGPFPSIVTGVDMKERVVVHTATIPRFHEDWAVTGPLIERFRLELAQDESGAWWAETGDIKDPAIQARADTPLEAICLAIIKLKAEEGEEGAHPDPVRR